MDFDEILRRCSLPNEGFKQGVILKGQMEKHTGARKIPSSNGFFRGDELEK